ncbi:MAG: TIGR04283 family arsenosugar biosynthesis glycosyltransferase [Thermoanaerobaculales bacterium]
MRAKDWAVVIPTLDEEGEIGACLDAIGNHSEVEVVVSDGGSSDATRKIALRSGALIVEGGAGRGPQLNRGAAASSARRMLFLHADCRLPKDWLPAVSEAVEDRDNALACFCLHTEPSRGEETSVLYRFWLRFFDLGSRGFRLPYGDQGFALRQEVFDRIGGFPDIPLMEDLAFARACARIGRVFTIPMEVRTTARRFERHPVRTAMIFATFPTLFRLGVSPEKLARWYRREE